VSADRVRELVATRALDEIVRLADSGAPVIRHVRSLLYTEDDLHRERAAEAVGALTPILARGDGRKLREILTALLWTLNDESGMSGRGTPEALGRILEARPELDAEIVPILVSYLEKEEVALNDELLDGGLLATLGRLGPSRVSLGPAGRERLEGMLRAPEPRLRGTAAWAVGRLRLPELRDEVNALLEDRAAFPLYGKGAPETPSVGEIAAEALEALD
jgi:hypothetical protein